MLWSKEICETSEDKSILKFNFNRPVKNVKCCDIYIGEKECLFACGNLVKRFYCPQKFDRENIKIVKIHFNTKTQEFSFELPCYSDDECKTGSINCSERNYISQSLDSEQNIVKLRRFTDICKLIQDGNELDLEAKFPYGFGSHLNDDTSLAEESLRSICKIGNPSRVSTVMRTISREKDETKDFCKDQYQLDFVDLQVPNGFENPMKFIINFNDYKLNSDEQYILDNIKKKKWNTPSETDIAEIDCGLVSILLGVCYDLRTTDGESTCESGWTRTILSSMMSYFEPIHNLKTVLEIFLRRSLIYPMYRNYELSQFCIQDTIEALNKGSEWIIKQLVITYKLFKSSSDSRMLLNKYYIEPYLRYVSSIAVTKDHLRMLSRNVKNVSLDMNKKKLRLNLSDIEAELLKELIDDIHLGNSKDSDDDDSNEDDDDDESCSDSDFESNSDEDEDNSVDILDEDDDEDNSEDDEDDNDNEDDEEDKDGSSSAAISNERK